MSEEKKNLFYWFEKAKIALESQKDTEFGLIILCFPLLERYLRETSGVAEGDLNDKFFDDLLVVLPELAERSQARNFWHIYRNGLLHQGAFSAQKKNGTIMSSGAISGNVSIIEFNYQDDCYYVNPNLFAERIFNFIRDDLNTIKASKSTNHEQPSVSFPHSWGPNKRDPRSPEYIPPPSGNFVD